MPENTCKNKIVSVFN